MNNLSPETVENPRAIGPICEATVIVPDLESSIDAYSRGLGWSVRGGVDVLSERVAGLLEPELAGRRFAIVEPGLPRASRGGVRLVEVPECIPIEPLRTHGWSALEVSVLDVEAATARAAAAGWRVLFSPIALGGGRLPLVAAQLAGPSGEGVYLTQILGEVEGFELPAPQRDVDGIFIVVLGSSSLEASRGMLETLFDVRRVSDRELPVRVVNAQYSFPADTVHRISSVQLEGRSCIEVDQLPSQAMPRGSRDAGVPAGILSVAIVSTTVTSAKRVQLPDGALLEIRPSDS